MSRYRRLSRQGLSLALTLIVVFSVIAGPVSASAGTATGEAQLGGPPANQLDTVDDDQLTRAS
ncbi:hypothetical protein, partial [Haloarcula sp. Atlit-120R]|uniref:hypothetical protein n=1 Tax=Haloarcula sp. Atlit-120R TaxID=2282135 RepID=UPI000FF5B05B